MLEICNKGKKRKVQFFCSETVAKRKFTKKPYILETPLYSSDSNKIVQIPVKNAGKKTNQWNWPHVCTKWLDDGFKNAANTNKWASWSWRLLLKKWQNARAVNQAPGCICICVCICICICICIVVCICVYIYTYLYTCIHMNMHT